MNEAMLIIEAKDLAADKISKGDHKKHHKKKEEEEEMIEVSKVKELLDGWDDTEHEYYKDVAKLVGHKDDEEEDIDEEEVQWGADDVG